MAYLFHRFHSKLRRNSSAVAPSAKSTSQGTGSVGGRWHGEAVFWCSKKTRDHLTKKNGDLINKNGDLTNKNVDFTILDVETPCFF